MDEWERTLRKTLQTHAEPIEAAPQLATAARTRSRALRVRQMVAVAAVVPLVLAAAGYGVAAALPGSGSRAIVPTGPPKPSKTPTWFNSVGCGAWSTPTLRIDGGPVAGGSFRSPAEFFPVPALRASAYYKHLEARYGSLSVVAARDFLLTGGKSTTFRDAWVIAGTSTKIVASVVVRVDNATSWSAVPVTKTGCFTKPAPTGPLQPTLPTCAAAGHPTTSLTVRSVNGPGGIHFTARCLYVPAGQPFTLTIVDGSYALSDGKPIPLDHLFLYRTADLPKVLSYGTGADTAVATIGTVRSGRRTIDLPALQPGHYMIYGGLLMKLTMLIVR